MSDKNKKIVTDFIQAMGNGDIEAIQTLLAHDVEAVTMGSSLISGSRGYDELIAGAAMFKQITATGIDFEIQHLTAEENRVSAEVKGRSELVSGAHYNNDYHFLIFIRDDKIIKIKEYVDTKLVDAVLAPLFN
ncbi:SnoaL-like domain-containing protein [Spongiibacter sp. KMU-166]|uniref:SnoaL-like domain-containing protein n=1 Tax=Spongiibacter thalassae TaxID=2721624 RepID=A0ABX1G9M4_9GAMM|nr:nuclear transport factor 2 family protein [Spongiibacter thalassae]NKI15854.1 SnoaL-like domain-containing protein [Spongiibacter thalassae]